MKNEDRPRLLYDFLDEKSKEAFAWGVNDCCLFAADWVKRLTDVDPMADLRGTYSTEEEAGKLIAGLGGLEAAITEKLKAVNAEEKSPLFAQRGDIVLADLENGLTVGICEGVRLFSVRNGETASKPMTKAVKAWRIP